MIEFLLDNKAGQIWDISDLVSEMTWKTARSGSPSSLDFTLIKGSLYQSKDFELTNGSLVRVRKDGHHVFFGYIFELDYGNDEAVKVKAYDQMRYLMYKFTYVFSKMTAADIIRRIAGDFGLKVGTLTDTPYVIPSMVEEDQTLLDIISKALTLTLVHSGQNLVFYDNFGFLELRDIQDMQVELAIGEQSLMTDYSYKRSIDGETYNRVMLLQKNGQGVAYTAEDKDNIAKWGLLQWFETVDDQKTEAQIHEMKNQILALKNREQRSMTVQALGDLSLRAGCYVHIHIDEHQIEQYFLVDECTHNFRGDDHTMSLKLKVI